MIIIAVAASQWRTEPVRMCIGMETLVSRDFLCAVFMRSVVATTHYTATILVTRNNLFFLLCCYSSYCGFFLLHCYCFTCCLRQINVFNDLYTWWKTQSGVLLQSCIGKISLSFDKWLKYGEFQLRIWNRCQRITSECAVSANELGACALLGSCRFKICIFICGGKPSRRQIYQ